MAWTVVSQTNGTGNKTAGTSATASITADAGDILFALCVADDVSGVDAIGTGAVTDAINTWTRRASNQAQTAATAVTQALFSTTVASAMSSTTVTFAPNTTSAAKNFMVMRCTGGTETVRVTTQTGSGTTTPYASLTHTGPLNGDLVIGFWAGERPTGEAFTDDTDTTNGSWSASTNDWGTSGGSAVTNVRGQTQNKIVTADGSQSWDCSGNNADYRNLLIVFQASASTPDPAPRPIVLQAAALELATAF